MYITLYTVISWDMIYHYHVYHFIYSNIMGLDIITIMCITLYTVISWDMIYHYHVYIYTVISWDMIYHIYIMNSCYHVYHFIYSNIMGHIIKAMKNTGLIIRTTVVHSLSILFTITNWAYISLQQGEKQMRYG